MKFHISGSFKRIVPSTTNIDQALAPHVMASIALEDIQKLLENEDCTDIQISIEPDTRDGDTD